MYSLNPQDHNLTNENIYEWRKFLKKELLKQRNFRSDFSNKSLHSGSGCHLHEGIITRATLPKSVWWHVYIYHPYNCFLLLPDEHIPNPPSREWAIQKAVDRYGLGVVRDWFYTLPWKVIPFQI